MSSLPPPDLRSRILDAIEREPVPSRAARSRRRALAVVIGFASLLTALAVVGPKMHARPAAYVAALVFAWLPIAALATWAGVTPGRSMLGRPVAWRVAVVTLTPVALMAAWAGVAMIWPAMLQDTSTIKRHFICDAATLGFSIGPLVAFTIVRRASDPVNPRLTGAAIGTAAATWAAVVLHLICGYTSGAHMLFGHVAPVVLLALIGSVLTARTVAIRTKTG